MIKALQYTREMLVYNKELETLTDSEKDYIKEFLLACSDIYYNTDHNFITDTEYDKLYNRYLFRGGEPFVGSYPDDEDRTISANHNYQELVGTTLKAKCFEDVEDYLDKVYKKLKLVKSNKLCVCVTFKFDGNSVLIEYDDKGHVIRALTRGRNGKGKDITKVFNAKRFHINNIYGKNLAIKYECLIKYSRLENMEETFNKSYVNPRNAISGMVNGDDALRYRDFYTLEPLWMKIEDNTEVTREEEIEFFKQLNDLEEDNTSNVVMFNYPLDQLKIELRKYYNKVINHVRKDLDFMIDGLVIDIVDYEYRDILGYQDGGENIKPKWCIALKFPYMEEESEVTSIKFSMADSGRISPVCYFKPVKILGATHQKQYLQGYKRFKELGLCKGTRIKVQLRNDTLSYIERLDSKEIDKELGRKPIPFIKNCPICGEPITITENKTFAYCDNEMCPGKVTGNINNYLTKMDIKGIKLNTVEKFHESGLWNNIEDLYTFDPIKAYDIEGLGKDSVNKIMRSIERKEYYDYEILSSIGIRNFGPDNAKLILSRYSLEDLMEAAEELREIKRDGNKELYESQLNDNIDALTEIKGIEVITAKKFMIHITKTTVSILISFLMSRGYKKYVDTLSYDDKLYTFVITGDLESCNREIFKKILERHGHKVVGSVSNKTDYLITNTPNSGTVKNKKARELGKEIISEEQCIKLLNLNIEEELKSLK